MDITRQQLQGPPMIPWAAGRFYTCPFAGSRTTGQTFGVNFRAHPFYVPNLAGVTVTSLGVLVTTAGTAGHLARLGIYEDDDGVPGKLVIDAGTVPVDPGSVPTFESATISQFLRQGWYWAAGLGQSGSTEAFTSVIADWFGIPEPRETSHYTTVRAILDTNQRTDYVLGGLPGRFPLLTATGEQTETTGVLFRIGV